IDGPVLLRDGDDADLLALERISPVREFHWAVGLRVHELLEIVLGEVVAYSDHHTRTPYALLHADKDVRFGVPPAVGEGENVLKQFALLLVRREGILVPFVVEGRAFTLA